MSNIKYHFLLALLLTFLLTPLSSNSKTSDNSTSIDASITKYLSEDIEVCKHGCSYYPRILFVVVIILALFYLIKVTGDDIDQAKFIENSKKELIDQGCTLIASYITNADNKEYIMYAELNKINGFYVLEEYKNNQLIYSDKLVDFHILIQSLYKNNLFQIGDFKKPNK